MSKRLKAPALSRTVRMGFIYVQPVDAILYKRLN